MSRPERLLLDTHVWLWFALGTAKKIAPAALKTLEDTAKSRGLMVSIVSIWELALLVARERIVLPLPLNDWVALALSRPEIKLVGLSQPNTVIDSVNLPGEIHADPADRFLIATARNRRATLATHDDRIIAYGQSGHVRVLRI
ncbi:MAG TPA: type II toxin-antitoxin system VapC family toxin [Steroidobacteraceae bacterium]